MKKNRLSTAFALLLLILFNSSLAQTLVFNPGNSGGFCGGGQGCPQQPNYDVAVNSGSGDIYILKKEFNLNTFNYKDEIIKYNSTGTRINTWELRSGTYKNIVADGSNVYVLSVHGDSVVVDGFSQATLLPIWYQGIYLGNSPVGAVGMILAFGNLYYAFTDAGGLHIRRLNPTTGAIISAIDYNTSFPSTIHAVDIANTNTGIVVGGWTDEPGTTKGESACVIKFNSSLVYQWIKRYNKNLSLTNNSDRASHVRVVNNFVYLVGTSQKSSGDYDAFLIKYTNGGVLQWNKLADKGADAGVDVAIDNSNDDAYLLQNSNVAGTPKIFVTRYNSAGTSQWSKAYAGTPGGTYTSGRNIYADPNPGGTGCEIFVSGVLDCTGSDPHGYMNGSSYLFYKYNRTGVKTNYMGSATAFIGPLKGLYHARYFPAYPGSPRLILLGDGDNSNPSPGYYCWDMYVYNISSIARLSDASGTEQPGIIRLTPNPAHGEVKIETADPADLVRIIDMTGKVVYEMQPASNTITVTLNSFEKGIYIVQSISKESISNTRLIVE